MNKTSAIVLAVLIAIGFVRTASAGSSTTGPSITLERTEVAPGDRVGLSIAGFRTRIVTISICGNAAARGASDCDMASSKGLRLDLGTPTRAQIGVTSPPAPCPCVVRASSPSNDEVAVAAITLAGHPVGPVVKAANLTAPLVAMTINARTSAHGPIDWVRSNLGGPVHYEVTVTVTNLTTEPIHRLSLSGSVGRDRTDQLAALALANPAEIGPGQTWKQVLPMSLPAPSVGALDWRVSASQAGPTVDARTITRRHPVLLLALTMALVVDLALLAIRQRMRRRAAREVRPAAEAALRTRERGLDVTSVSALGRRRGPMRGGGAGGCASCPGGLACGSVSSPAR